MIKEFVLFHMTALVAGIVIDSIIPDPHTLPHPIRAIGKLIGTLEKALYKAENDRANLVRGAVLWILTMAVTGVITAAILFISYSANSYAGLAVETILTFYIMAAGSLRYESMKVYHGLVAGNIQEARGCLSMIVGRDTKDLDEDAIRRAAVETVAENTSDGVIAPLLYTAVFGPVGGLLYKAVNTMDSMIGYNDSRYAYFGRFAAKADDVFNYFPSRISAAFMIAASAICELSSHIINNKKTSPYSVSRSFRIYRRDRKSHKSPNSAQTESVCAGSLGLLLGGDSSYKGVIVHKPYIGDDVRPIEDEDIRRAIKLMYVTEGICTAVTFILIKLILISL